MDEARMKQLRSKHVDIGVFLKRNRGRWIFIINLDIGDRYTRSFQSEDLVNQSEKNGDHFALLMAFELRAIGS